MHHSNLLEISRQADDASVALTAAVTVETVAAVAAAVQKEFRRLYPGLLGI
jgi:hypothetical protein